MTNRRSLILLPSLFVSIFLLASCVNNSEENTESKDNNLPNYCELKVDTYEDYVGSMESYYELYKVDNRVVGSYFTIESPIKDGMVLLDLIADNEEETYEITGENKFKVVLKGSVYNYELQPGTYYILDTKANSYSVGQTICFNEGIHYAITSTTLEKTIQHFSEK